MDSEDRLDEDFMFYLSFAEQNWASVNSQRDKELCQAWLYKLSALQKTRAEKRDRNVYLSRLGLAMAEGEMSGPFVRRPPEGLLPSPSDVFGPPQPHIQVPAQFSKQDKSKDLNTAHVSKDGRTYVATKSLGKGHGAYTYIGISLAEDEPRWVGGDSAAIPCEGFDHHFQKAHVFYSKASPRYPSTIFSVEQSDGGGDKVEHTKPFTDYATFANEPKMSGTHIPDFGTPEPSPRLEESSTSAPEAAPREKKGKKSSGSADSTDKREPIHAKPIGQSTQLPEKLKKQLHSMPKKESQPIIVCKTEEPEAEELPLCRCGEYQIPIQRTYKTAAAAATAASSDLEGDLAGFYTAMINNANNAMNGKENLNEFNTEKAKEIKEKMQKKLKNAELLNILKENLIDKLRRIRKEEQRVIETIRDAQVSMLYSTTESDDVIFESSLRLVCETLDEQRLERLEEEYNAEVRDRMAKLMKRAKKEAVKSKMKEIRRQSSTAREEKKEETEKLQTRKKIANDYLKKANEVLDEIEDMESAVKSKDSHFIRRRNKADKLTGEVQQLCKLSQVEANRCWQLQEQLRRRPDSVYNDPLIATISYDNMNLMRGIIRLQAYLRKLKN